MNTVKYNRFGFIEAHLRGKIIMIRLLQESTGEHTRPHMLRQSLPAHGGVAAREWGSVRQNTQIKGRPETG
jgi:hypothetical protein